jgi:NitT/TauT family transport system permease protein
MATRSNLAEQIARPQTHVNVRARIAGWVHRHERFLLSVVSVTLFFVLWEGIARLGLVKSILISSPSQILQAAQWLLANGFWYDIGTSLLEFAFGFGLAVLVAVPLGLAMGWSSRLNAIFDPYAQALNAAPRIALIPVIMLWLGIGLISKVAVVFLGAFFPILLSAVAGVHNMDALLLRCAQLFGADRRQIFRTIALPSSVPWLITGMRVGVGRALVGVVVAELLASTAGVGHMMSVAGATFQTDKVFVGILLIAGFGWGVSEILRRVEEHYQAWRPKN